MEGIYCYIDLKTDEVVYVGKDSHIDKNMRYKRHLIPSCYNEQQINRVLQNNPQRYQYTVLKQGNFSHKLLNVLEILYIKRYNPLFNFTKGGEGLLGFNHSDETKEKLRKAHLGKKQSLETRRKLSEYHKGRKLPKETCEKIRQSHLGEKNHFYGKKHSNETKIKMSQAKNTSGYFRVHKDKNKRYPQGFRWVYEYYENGKSKRITSVDINKLEEKVKSKGLEWFKIEIACGGS